MSTSQYIGKVEYDKVHSYVSMPRCVRDPRLKLSEFNKKVWCPFEIK